MARAQQRQQPAIADHRIHGEDQPKKDDQNLADALNLRKAGGPLCTSAAAGGWFRRGHASRQYNK